MKKVFSYSLYDSGKYYGGSEKKYIYNMIANILISQKLFPDWKLYVYYDKSLPERVIRFLLKSSNVVAKNMDNHWLSRFDKMMWRNLAMDEQDIDIVCIRDCDNWLCYREKMIMEHWIKSNKDIHIIRDHCWHAGKIGGGLWGRKNNLTLKMESLMKNYFQNNRKHKTHSGEDQDFLTNNFYEKFKDNTIVYIGEQYDKNGNYLPRGHHPNEPCIKKINDLIQYSNYLNDTNKHEFVKGFSSIEVSQKNNFYCGRCNKKIHVFIGNMYNHIPEKSLDIIEFHLNNI